MICESDAEAKWCPFSRVLSTQGVHNRVPKDPRQDADAVNALEEAALCMGGACMAWRWIDPEGSDEGYCGLVPNPPIMNIMADAPALPQV